MPREFVSRLPAARREIASARLHGGDLPYLYRLRAAINRKVVLVLIVLWLSRVELRGPLRGVIGMDWQPAGRCHDTRHVRLGDFVGIVAALLANLIQRFRAVLQVDVVARGSFYRVELVRFVPCELHIVIAVRSQDVVQRAGDVVEIGLEPGCLRLVVPFLGRRLMADLLHQRLRAFTKRKSHNAVQIVVGDVRQRLVLGHRRLVLCVGDHDHAALHFQVAGQHRIKPFLEVLDLLGRPAFRHRKQAFGNVARDVEVAQELLAVGGDRESDDDLLNGAETPAAVYPRILRMIKQFARAPGLPLVAHRRAELPGFLRCQVRRGDTQNDLLVGRRGRRWTEAILVEQRRDRRTRDQTKREQIAADRAHGISRWRIKHKHLLGPHPNPQIEAVDAVGILQQVGGLGDIRGVRLPSHPRLFRLAGLWDDADRPGPIADVVLPLLDHQPAQVERIRHVPELRELDRDVAAGRELQVDAGSEIPLPDANAQLQRGPNGILRARPGARVDPIDQVACGAKDRRESTGDGLDQAGGHLSSLFSPILTQLAYFSALAGAAGAG